MPSWEPDWEDAEEKRVLVQVLRALKGWSQKEATRASRLGKNVLSFCELGKQTPSRKVLERLSEAVGLAFSRLGPFRALLSRLRAGLPPAPVSEEAIQTPAATVSRAVAREVEIEAALLLALTPGRDEIFVPPSARDLARGDALWDRLQRYPRERWRVLLQGARAFRCWALCARLCAESVRAAATEPAEALFLVDISLLLASRIHGGSAWRSRLLGFCMAHRANALRVANDLEGAEQAIVRAWALWRKGASALSPLLSEVRLLDLEASLRREQRRFSRALALLDEALPKSRGNEATRILLNKSFTLEQMEDYDQALATLLQAKPKIDAKADPRLACVLLFNLAVNLCHMDRHREAERLLPETRQLATALGHDLDLLRQRWLEGRVAAGLGRTEEGESLLAAVREEFKKRNLPYDAALAGLDLAALYIKDGRTAEVKALAEDLLQVFLAHGIHREAEKALVLFRDATLRETATLAFVQKLLRYLNRAQRDPKLRFEV